MLEERRSTCGRRVGTMRIADVGIFVFTGLSWVMAAFARPPVDALTLMRLAERWTQDQLKSWGLQNVRTESFDVGRGGWIESAPVRMITPRPLELHSIPIAWTPARAPLAAPIVVAPLRTEKDFETGRGKLGGKIVLTGAHLDSWVAGDGVADNGAGSAIVLETAIRLLLPGKPVPTQPRLTDPFHYPEPSKP